MNIYESLKELFQSSDIAFDESVNSGGATCEEASRLRGLDIGYGLKSILFKGKKGFFLASVRASYQVDSQKVRKAVGSNKLRFATEEELLTLCHVVKGALPPFGDYLYGLEHIVDESVNELEKVVFNAGDITKTMIINTEDYLRVTNINLVKITK